MKLKGNILTARGWFLGEIAFGQVIEGIRGKSDAKPRYIVPGFVDVHVHGGGGGDAMDGAVGLSAMTRFHAAHGTTALLATTITNPWAQVVLALNSISSSRVLTDGGARVLGAHLEGPFINPARLGAQPPFALLPTPERVREILELDVVRVVTIAPELEGALEAIAQFLTAGVRVSLVTRPPAPKM